MFSISTGSTNANSNNFAQGLFTLNITNKTNIELKKESSTTANNVSLQVIELIDRDAPIVNLIYPINEFNFSSYTIEQFNFSVTDYSTIINCSLYGNWTTGWHINQTIQNPAKSTVLNFSSINTESDGFYIWNVKCVDQYDNIGFNSTNFTFSTYLPPDSPVLYNISQTSNEGTGNITLFWNSSNHTIQYKIYYGSNMSSFSLLNTTSQLNYTDTGFSGNKRRFYYIEAVNPIGQNSSQDYFGAHVYTLGHNGNTRNWIGFPTNASYLTNANETLNEIRNATAFTMWNATTQNRVTCNLFTCPSYPSCTDTTCNFDLSPGAGYELNINSSVPSLINWSLVGIVYSPVTINLIKNSTDFGKNWIAMYANTSLINANNLINNITNADAVTNWDNQLQKSKGYIYVPGWGIYIGTNFNTEIEKGYEVSVTADTDWMQA